MIPHQTVICQEHQFVLDDECLLEAIADMFGYANVEQLKAANTREELTNLQLQFVGAMPIEVTA